MSKNFKHKILEADFYKENLRTLNNAKITKTSDHVRLKRVLLVLMTKQYISRQAEGVSNCCIKLNLL